MISSVQHKMQLFSSGVSSCAVSCMLEYSSFSIMALDFIDAVDSRIMRELKKSKILPPPGSEPRYF